MPLYSRGSGSGGSSVTTDALLIGWANSQSYQLSSPTYDSDKVLQTALVVWPDGSSGTFTRTAKNNTHLTVDGYTITHVGTGKTITQPTVTRGTTGEITVQPAITIA